MLQYCSAPLQLDSQLVELYALQERFARSIYTITTRTEDILAREGGETTIERSKDEEFLSGAEEVEEPGGRAGDEGQRENDGGGPGEAVPHSRPPALRSDIAWARISHQYSVGSGAHQFTEYKVRPSLPSPSREPTEQVEVGAGGQQRILFRRFRQFRELHKRMKGAAQPEVRPG